MSMILDNIPSIVFATDREGTIQLHRGLGAQKIGMSSAELEGRSAFEVFAGAPAIVAVLTRSLDGERVRYETDIGGRLLDTSLEPLRDGSGVVTGIVGIAADITERKQAEESYRRTKEMLEA